MHSTNDQVIFHTVDQCPEFDLSGNLRELAGSGFHIGAIRLFQCQQGFTFDSGVTQVTVQCQDNGQWSPEIPSCSGMCIFCGKKN